MINIGNRIREIRTSKKITVSKLAEEIGVAQSFVSGIEAGTKKCSLENLDKICHALGITLNDFFAPSEETELSSEIRRVIERVKKLPADKLKVLESVLDTWVDSDLEKNLESNKRPLKVLEYPNKENNKIYLVADKSNEYDKIDVRSTPMAAHLEDAESIPLTPELEEIIKDGIRESRQRKQEREAKLKQQIKEGNNKATTDNQ